MVDEVATLSFAQDSLATLAKVETPVWKKQDKFDKFMNKLVSETISNVSMNFVGGLKAY